MSDRTKSMFDDPAKLAESLEGMEHEGGGANILSPTTQIAYVPELHEIRLTPIWIDPNKDSKEVYEPSGSNGGMALGRVALDKISAAAGVSWFGTVRQDDGSHPHYCSVMAEGVYRTFDGDWRIISGQKEVDFRDGGAEVGELKRKYAEDRSKWDAQGGKAATQGGLKYEPKAPDARIAEMRKHILAHAESKARNRALRSAFALKPTYSPAELARPFIVLKLVCTGRTDDPMLRELWARSMIESATKGVQSMYAMRSQAEGAARGQIAASRRPPGMGDGSGVSVNIGIGSSARPPALETQPQPIRELPARPRDEEHERDPDDDAPDAKADEEPSLFGRRPPSASAKKPAPSTASGGTGQSTSMSFGNCAGVPLTELGAKDLDWYEKALTENVANPDKARFKAPNQKALDAILAEKRARTSAA